MKQRIERVEPGSVAWKAGLRPGDAICAMNGEPLIDEIDYQALSEPARVSLALERADGTAEALTLRKQEGEPLGLRFGPEMALSPRTCRNHCVFCFIDQMPPRLRESLYVKDDDWRYSLMMGNFVTLTNVDSDEFDRILRRRASPLFVSVHTTDPDLRCRMMNNRFAGDILQRLSRLRDAGLRFHCQIVCCPGFNDGQALLRTLADLRALAPAALSVAIVPVGLTRFREGLAPLTPFTRDSAAALLDLVAPFQAECRATLGTTFVFPSDELFCLAERPVPPDAWYEDYPQIENGVGLLRQLETELEYAEEDEGDEGDVGALPQTPAGLCPAPAFDRAARGQGEGEKEKDAALISPLDARSASKEGSRAKPLRGLGQRPSVLVPVPVPVPHTLVLATGVSAAPHMRRLCARFAPKGTEVRVVTIQNRFFGESVTVAGLLTGGDVLAQLPEAACAGAEALLISASMLRHERDLFLDDMTLEEFRRRAPLPVRVVECDGQALYDALRGREREE